MFAWVGAGEVVSLSNLPHQLAVALGTTDFVGQLLSTSIFVMLFVIPTLYFTKGKNFMIALLVGFLTICVCVALAWLPVWVLIMLCLIAGGLMASNLRGWITGRGDR